jgi:hypothetical protein
MDVVNKWTVANTTFTVNGTTLKQVHEFIYLGHVDKLCTMGQYNNLVWMPVLKKYAACLV